MRCIELGSFGNKQKLKIAGFFASLLFLTYRRLDLPVNAPVQNKFSHDIKCEV